MGRKQRKMKKAANNTAATNTAATKTAATTKVSLQEEKEETEDIKVCQEPEVIPSCSKKHLSEDSTSNESGTESTATGSSTNSDNEEMPDLENCAEGGAVACAGDFTIPQSLLNPSKQTRGEKKARKILSKLDLRPIEGVSRVTMRKSKDVHLYIDKPDVFRYLNSDTYFFFGEVKVDDVASRAQAEAAEKFKDTETTSASDQNPKEKVSDDEEGEGDLFDVDGMDDKDIELVMMQANTSRAKAIRALREHENDVVNAIMALTMM